MSELGVIASKFSSNRAALNRFDEALKYIKSNRHFKLNDKTEDEIKKLLNVLNPISDNINDVLSSSIEISEQDVVDIIKERHSHDWPTYKEAVLSLIRKLNSSEFQVLDADIEMLNDIADALDAECVELFNRLGEGR